jgi:hypothetical protein
MPDRLDVVAVGIEHEGAVLPVAVLRAGARAADVATAVGERSGMELVDGVPLCRREGDVRAPRHGVLTGLVGR